MVDINIDEIVKYVNKKLKIGLNVGSLLLFFATDADVGVPKADHLSGLTA